MSLVVRKFKHIALDSSLEQINPMTIFFFTDLDGLINPEKIEVERTKFLKLFNVYTTGW